MDRGAGSAHGPAAGTTVTEAALRQLQEDLSGLHLPYTLAGADRAVGTSRLLRDQLGDYVLPRLWAMDAPLLAVVGGSTGAGKSTLVSSLVRRQVSVSSAIRPTTRRPLLLHATGDGPWFEDGRVLGSLARVRVAEAAPPTPAGAHTPREVEVRACSSLPPGLALLDAPDVDSVVDDNRALAATLLAAADLWIFVTTASRYADAVPWDHLRGAAARGVVTAVVLDRVPTDATETVTGDLRRRLDAAGLAGAPVFVVPETPLEADGFLPDAYVAPLRHWLGTLAADASARGEVARQTLTGALGSVLSQMDGLLEAVRAQDAEHDRLAAAAVTAHAEALERITMASADGSLLRGEVLARWQEFVGTGELWRGLESQVGRLRDRVTSTILGRPAPADRVEEAIESSVANLLVGETQRAALETERAWRRAGSAAWPLSSALSALATTAERARQGEDLVRHWQGDILDMVRAEGAGKRLGARLLSLGVNGVGVALMVVVFAHTGGLTGVEVGVAGGTALVAQRLLEAVFGDQAVRDLTRRSRLVLGQRVAALLDEQESVFTSALPIPSPRPEVLDEHARQASDAVGALTREMTR
ncbi:MULTISPECIES: dynamin family protein [Actinomyces]|uniref:Dynamin family protein n=1 Tax=Actinomyces respiraculi TaxID=2744574 RepID=A0A7T0LML2_9ACTO|nr:MULTISPECIES: dynamin family protein [Actinomyces]QPL06422.1 dynamin family protein [Actinomyces respiraculi]